MQLCEDASFMYQLQLLGKSSIDLRCPQTRRSDKVSTFPQSIKSENDIQVHPNRGES